MIIKVIPSGGSELPACMNVIGAGDGSNPHYHLGKSQTTIRGPTADTSTCGSLARLTVMSDRELLPGLSPRVFRVIALPAPTEREKSQMYVQRYIAHFPAAGEVVIFDRSWYNRAGVEQVMGFCTPQETGRFLQLVPAWEKAMTDSGILLLKYWLEVSPDEQTRRLESRIHDPLTHRDITLPKRQRPAATPSHTCRCGASRCRSSRWQASNR